MRHNALRNAEAELLQEVCKDVQIEPPLMPIDNEVIKEGTTDQGARLDISARGLWRQLEKLSSI